MWFEAKAWATWFLERVEDDLSGWFHRAVETSRSDTVDG